MDPLAISPMTTNYEVQQSWTVGGKTFPDKAAADGHALKLQRHDRAIALLVDAGVKRHHQGFGPDATSVVAFIQEHLEAFTQALATLRGEQEGSING